jgi:hypothetical protein
LDKKSDEAKKENPGNKKNYTAYTLREYKEISKMNILITLKD